MVRIRIDRAQALALYWETAWWLELGKIELRYWPNTGRQLGGYRIRIDRAQVLALNWDTAWWLELGIYRAQVLALYWETAWWLELG